MVARPTIGPGIDSIPTETIPGDPQGFVDWFKGVGLKRWFGPADVRNVFEGSGIAITNNGFNSPPSIAVSQNIQNLFGQPYILFGAPVGAPLTDYRSIAAQLGVLTLTDGGAEAALTVGVAANGIGSAQFRKSAALSVVGNASASSANVSDLTQAQLTALVNLATASLSGAIPALSGVATQFFNGVGAFSTPPAGSSGANPTASIGLAVVNGIATTFMRSDGAPALSQAISPTMTGAWTFSPAGAGVVINAPASGAATAIAGLTNTSTMLIQSNATSGQNVTDINVQRANGSAINTLGAGCGIGLQDTVNSNATRIQNSGGQTEFWQAVSSVFSQIMKFTTVGGVVINAPPSGAGLVVNGAAAAGTPAMTVAGSNTAGARGLTVLGGTASSDFAMIVANAANTTNLLLVFGDGGCVIGNPTGGNKGPGTLNIGVSLFVNGVAVTVP